MHFYFKHSSTDVQKMFGSVSHSKFCNISLAVGKGAGGSESPTFLAPFSAIFSVHFVNMHGWKAQMICVQRLSDLKRHFPRYFSPFLNPYTAAKRSLN
jgi:hypothetical protein